ncbi:unnamed protein product, partial [Rhizoctonia solani]
MADVGPGVDMEPARIKFRAEIEHRLKKGGWAADDMDSDYSGALHQYEWTNLVSESKELADRELFGATKKQSDLAVEVPDPHRAASTSDSALSIRASYEPTFPTVAHMLNFPAILDLFETDLPVTEMETECEKSRTKIERDIAEWKARIQGRFINLVPKGTKEPTPPTATGDNYNTFTTISHALKFVLRADSFLHEAWPPGSGRSWKYTSFIDSERWRWDYKFASTDPPLPPPHCDHVRWDSTHKTRKDPDLVHIPIACRNTHRFQRETDSPLVKQFEEQISDEFEKHVCKLCPKLLIMHEVVASEEEVREDVLLVHGIADPETDEEYGLYDEQMSDGKDGTDSENGGSISFLVALMTCNEDAQY